MATKKRLKREGTLAADLPALPAPGDSITAAERVDRMAMLTMMVRIRAFEMKLAELVRDLVIKGTLHPYVGQEAVATGVCFALRPDDYITSNHRGHGHALAKGADMKRMMAELLGRQTGYCKGKGGSMHIADLDLGMLGCNGIVGGGLGITAGAALSAKLRGTDQVSVGFFGDGAANTGIAHEAMNLAAAWQLPAIFICENNQYALSMPYAKAMRCRISRRGRSATACPARWWTATTRWPSGRRPGGPSCTHGRAAARRFWNVRRTAGSSIASG